MSKTAEFFELLENKTPAIPLLFKATQLIQEGADINAKNNDGKSLGEILIDNSVDSLVLKIFIAAGLDQDFEGLKKYAMLKAHNCSVGSAENEIATDCAAALSNEKLLLANATSKALISGTGTGTELNHGIILSLLMRQLNPDHKALVDEAFASLETVASLTKESFTRKEEFEKFAENFLNNNHALTVELTKLEAEDDELLMDILKEAGIKPEPEGASPLDNSTTLGIGSSK